MITLLMSLRFRLSGLSSDSGPHYIYLNVSNIREEKFSLRYLGQDVATITKTDDCITLNIAEKQVVANEKYFGFTQKVVNEPWRSAAAKEMRRYFTHLPAEKLPRQKEHRIESFLYTEFEKRTATGKALIRIQPVKYANCRIHMCTALSASLAKDDAYSIASKGKSGDIDILCRYRKGSKTDLTVIEVKDENKKSESVEKAMFQAICYAVFICVLLRESDPDDKWSKILGVKKDGALNINVVPAMPLIDPSEEYSPLKIALANKHKDTLTLHYMLFTESATGIDKIKTSLS